MPFGLLPEDLVGDGQLMINVLSDNDDFRPKTRVDPSEVVAVWGSARFCHKHSIFNVGTGKDETGEVYERIDDIDARSPRDLARHSRTGLIVTAALLSLGTVAALTLRRRK